MANRLSLSNLLQQQQQRLTQLLESLVAETEALVNRDVESIEQLLKQKAILLEEIRLADIGISRHPELVWLQDPTSAEDPNAVAELQQQLQSCQQLLADCQQRNQHNHTQAEQITASLNRLQQLLQSTSHSNAITYTDKGNTHVGSRLGKAITA